MRAAGVDPDSFPTIVDALAHWARETPSAPFLSEGEQTWSFAGFHRRVGCVARWLHERGVGPGDRVVVHIARKSEHVLAYLAILSLGAITTHVYPERPRSYVDFAARAVDARFVVTLDPWPEGERAYAVLALGEADSPLWRDARSPVAYLMFTSGTTSSPKAVVTTHANERTVTGNLIRMAAMRRGDRELIFMPLGSTGGAGHLHAVLRLGNHARLLGWFMATVDDTQLAEMLRRVDVERIDGFLATPAIITRLLANHRPALSRAGQRLRYMLANVTPMRRSVVRDLLDTLPGLRFVTYYGLTEASRSVINTCRESPGAEHATGRATPGIEVRLDAVDPRTGIGQVFLRGPNVSPGYWGEWDGRSDRGWFATGDLARMDDDGRLWVLGRMNDVISIDGLKVIPSVLETVLRGEPGVADCAVVPVDDPVTWQRIGAAVVPSDDALDLAGREALAGRLLARCAASLPVFQVPRRIHVLSALPRTDLGKIRRGALAARIEELEA